MKHTRRWRTAALAVLSVLLVELALRPFIDRSGARLFVPDDELGWRLRPGAEETWGGVPVRINSHGLRGPEVAWEKPPGTRRILFLGDSVTFGYGLASYQEAFPHLTADLLEELLGVEVEALNAGVGGYSPWQELRYLERDGLRYAPDVVVVSFVLNDVTEKFELIRFGGHWRGFHLSRAVPDSWIERLSQTSGIVHFARRLGARIRFGKDVQAGAREVERLDVGMLVSEPDRPEIVEAWDLTLQNVGAIFELCEGHEIPAFLVIVPFAFQLEDPEGLAAPQRRLLAFAAERGIGALDLLPILHRRLGEQGLGAEDVFRDPSHLSPAGSRIVAEAIAGAIASALVRGDQAAERRLNDRARGSKTEPSGSSPIDR